MRRVFLVGVLGLFLAATGASAAESAPAPAGQVVITAHRDVHHRVVRRWVTRRVVVREHYYRHGRIHYYNRVVYRRYPVYDTYNRPARHRVVVRIGGQQ